MKRRGADRVSEFKETVCHDYKVGDDGNTCKSWRKGDERWER